MSNRSRGSLHDIGGFRSFAGKRKATATVMVLAAASGGYSLPGWAADPASPSAPIHSAVAESLSHQPRQPIVRLVASHTEDLGPASATMAGEILSTDGTAAVAIAARGNQQTVAFQNRLNASLQGMLDAVVGPGNAVVTTTAELNFDRVETNTKTYTGDPAVAALAESISRQAYTRAGGGPDNAGLPGGAFRYEKTSTVRNNAINEIHQTRRSAPGAVQRLNVAVLLDSTRAGAVDPARIQQLVGVAAGIDAARGDSIAVAAMPFDTSTAEQAQRALAESAADEAGAKQEALYKTIGLALLVLIVLFMAWRAGRRRSRRGGFSIQPKSMQAAAQQRRPAVLTSTISQAAAEPPREMDLRRQRAIERMVEDRPQEVASLLRGWTTPDR